MRIAGWSIEGFGLFAGLTIERLPGGLSVFCGPNEAGKSTLLGFIRAMLFGFPRANAPDLPLYPPLAGGRHGGRLELELDGGERYTVERFHGRGGHPAVMAADGRGGAEELLDRLLGGVSAELYRSIYAFGLGELQDGRSLRDEAVQGALYGAGAGASGRSLPEARRRLGQRLDELLKPRGTTPRLNQLVAALAQNRRSLAEAGGAPEAYAAAVAALEAVQAGLAAADRQLAQLRPQLSRVESYLKLWPDWIELLNCERALDAAGPASPFPPDGRARLETLVAARSQHEQRLHELRLEVERKRESLDGLVVDRQVLAAGAQIETLERGRERYVEDGVELVRLSQEQAAAQAELDRLLQRLGAGWTEERLRRIDRSLFARDAVRQHEAGLAAARAAVTEAAGQVEVRAQQRQQASDELAAARARLAALPAPPAQAPPGVVQALERGRDQLAAVARDLPAVRAQRRHAGEQLARALREIGPGWTQERLGGFDASIAAQERIQQFEQRLEAARQRCASLRERVAEAARQQAEAAGRVRVAQQELDALPQPPVADAELLRRQRVCLREVRGKVFQRLNLQERQTQLDERLNERRGEQQRLAQLAPGPGPSPAFAAIWLALVPLLWLWLRPAPGAALLAVLAGAAGAAASAALLWRHRRRASARLAAHAGEQTRLLAAVHALEERAQSLRREAAALDEAIAAAAPACGLGAAPAPDEVDRQEASLEQRERALATWEQQRDRVAQLQAEASRLAAAAAAQAAALAAAEGEAESLQEEWAAHLSQGGLPAGMLPRTALLLFGKVDALREQARALAGLEDRVAQMEAAVEQYAATAGTVPQLAAQAERRDPTELVAAVDGFVREWHEQEERRRQRAALEEAWAKCQRRHEQAAADSAQAEANLECSRQRLADVEQAWQAWLAQSGLDNGLVPSTAIEAIDAVERGLAAAARRDQAAAQRGAVRERSEGFGREVAALLAELGRAVPPAERLPAVVRALYEECQTARDRAGRAEELRRAQAEAEAQLAAAQQALAQVETDIAALCAAAGVADAEQFRERAAAVERRQELARQIAALATNLGRIAGTDDLAALRAELAATSRAALEQEAEALRRQADEQEAERVRLIEQRARLQQQLESLRNSDQAARLRTEREQLKAELQAAAREWITCALARWLLDTAREQYEREQQPEVVREASAFLARITGGRYVRVVAPVGEQRLEVVAATGARRQPAELSRGTAELLYLAMRFGFIRHRARLAEALPVVMDDILANFDPERCRRAAGAIAELARTHQVLFFTCHPETAELFGQVEPGVTVYEFGAGGIQARQ